MSIATQIQRLINAKKAIKSSIVNKSVTVADTVKLDGYGTLINQIGVNANIGPNDVIKGKMAFGNNGKYFSGTALSVQTSANNTRILNGFTAYDSNGQLLTGSALPTATTAQNNRIMQGYTAYTNTGVLLSGTAFGNVTNATNSSLLKGHTAYLNNGMWLNGTAFGGVTNATNAKILNGYTAYLNNGLLLTGTALGNSTNANNARILNGFTAYDSNGAWLQGTAFGNSTNVTNEMIFKGMTAYLNDGTYLVGTMRNRANLTQGVSNFFANNSYIVMQPLFEGYYDTASKLRYSLQDAMSAMNAVKIATGTVTADDDEWVYIDGLSFEPKGVVLFYEADELDWNLNTMETPIVTWDLNMSEVGKSHTVWQDGRGGEIYLEYQKYAADIYYYSDAVEFQFDTGFIDADWTYIYVVWG